jgi:hypothetical protein
MRRTATKPDPLKAIQEFFVCKKPIDQDEPGGNALETAINDATAKRIVRLSMRDARPNQ